MDKFAADTVVMSLDEARVLVKGQTGDFEHGYVAALMQLQNSLRQNKIIPDNQLQKVIAHIQDLILRCGNCGSWLYSDGSCLTCEMLAKVEPVVPDVEVIAQAKPRPKKK